MSRFFGFVFTVAAIAGIYMVMSDPAKKEKVLGTLEQSTGVTSTFTSDRLAGSADKLADKTGKAVSSSAKVITQELKKYYSDPAFRKSLQKWGKQALNSISPDKLKDLKEDLANAVPGSESNYDIILNKYLAPDSDM